MEVNRAGLVDEVVSGEGTILGCSQTPVGAVALELMGRWQTQEATCLVSEFVEGHGELVVVVMIEPLGDGYVFEVVHKPAGLAAMGGSAERKGAGQPGGKGEFVTA